MGENEDGSSSESDSSSEEEKNSRGNRRRIDKRVTRTANGVLKKAKTKNGLEEIKEEYNNETLNQLDEPEAKNSASSGG